MSSWRRITTLVLDSPGLILQQGSASLRISPSFTKQSRGFWIPNQSWKGERQKRRTRKQRSWLARKKRRRRRRKPRRERKTRRRLFQILSMRNCLTTLLRSSKTFERERGKERPRNEEVAHSASYNPHNWTIRAQSPTKSVETLKNWKLNNDWIYKIIHKQIQPPIYIKL